MGWLSHDMRCPKSKDHCVASARRDDGSFAWRLQGDCATDCGRRGNLTNRRTYRAFSQDRDVSSRRENVVNLMIELIQVDLDPNS